MIDELLTYGIEPIVTLYHYDLPWALVEKYQGWLDRRIVTDFEYYAKFVINEFKDKVKYWTTINEQSIIVSIGHKMLYPERASVTKSVALSNQPSYEHATDL